MRYVVIMAGGSGKRLWPLSRQGTPKQLLKLVEGKSLLRIAYERIQGSVPPENVLVCTGAAYADTVAAELPEIPHANLLGEPVGRDSLNAVAWPAAVLAERDPEAVVAMLTADALMDPEENFRAALEQAYTVAEKDPSALVTFGVVPTSPHTGYGYLQQGAEVAGVPGAREIAQHPEKLEAIFPTLQKISVDYAVMEPVGAGKTDAHVVGVPLDITWHDVGGFASLAEQLTQDADGNAIEGLASSIDSAGNLILNRCGDDHLVGVVGLQDTVVVAMPDVTMVCPLEKSEQIKKLVEQIAADHPQFA